jgi:hypothetical protein
MTPVDSPAAATLAASARCTERPDSLSALITSNLPSPPHFAAGALGGPFVIAALTPLRNAMSNAAQDQRSTFTALYQRSLGPPTLPPLSRLRIGFTGAAVSAPAACPQWLMIGPAFHVLHAHLITPLAILGAAFLETAITYGSQTRNAQMAYCPSPSFYYRFAALLLPHNCSSQTQRSNPPAARASVSDPTPLGSGGHPAPPAQLLRHGRHPLAQPPPAAPPHTCPPIWPARGCC